MNNELMKTRIKRAYEWARFRQSLILLAWTIPLMAISLYACGTPLISTILGILVSLLVVLMFWRGQTFGSAALIGLSLGSAAFFVPLCFHLAGVCCNGNLEQEVCIGTGAVIGAIFGRIISKLRSHRIIFSLSAFSIIVLAAIMGCAPLGLSATAGLVFAIVISAVPSYGIFRKLS